MKFFKLTLGLGLLSCISQAWAVPSAFTSECGALNLQNPTNSTLLRDHKACNQVWVLPPSMGSISVREFDPSGNLGFCKAAKSVQRTAVKIAERIGSYSGEIDRLQRDINKAEKQLAKAERAYAHAKEQPVVKEMLELTEKLESIDGKITEIIAKLETCQHNCDELYEEYKHFREARKIVNSDLKKLRDENHIAFKKMTKAEQAVEAAENHLTRVETRVAKKVKRQNDLHDSLMGLYTQYSSLEGGFAHVAYDTGWDENVKELEELYPEYDFKKVITKNAKIFANFVGSSEKATYLDGVPKLLDYNFAGLKFTPFGEERTPEVSSLPSQMTGSLRLSVIGSCPVYYSNFLADSDEPLEERDDFSNIGVKFGVSASYEYAAAFKLKMTASYNLYKMYERVVESGRKSGFFTSRSWTNVIEKQEDRDTFFIDWDIEDPESKYDQQKRDEIRKALKAELIGRVMTQMGRPMYSPSNPNNLKAPLPPTSGAIVFAKGIGSTCGYFNIWCRGASWVLIGLNSVFGSSKSVSRFKRIHNVSATETWSETIPRYRAGATSFVPQSEVF